MSRDVFVKSSHKQFLDVAGVYVIYADHYDKRDMAELFMSGRVIVLPQDWNLTLRKTFLE